MAQITLDIPEFYNRRLEYTAKMQQRTFQEIILDAIQKFVDSEQMSISDRLLSECFSENKFVHQRI